MADNNSEQAPRSDDRTVAQGRGEATRKTQEEQGSAAYQGAPKEQLDRMLPIIAYILFLVSPITAGVSLLFGGAIAIVNRHEEGLVASHYSNMITTLAISLGTVLIAYFAWSWAAIGALIYLVWTLWVILRSVVGISYLNRGVPVPQPQSWWLGKEAG